MLRSTLVYCIRMFSYTVIPQLDVQESAELSKIFVLHSPVQNKEQRVYCVTITSVVVKTNKKHANE